MPEYEVVGAKTKRVQASLRVVQGELWLKLDGWTVLRLTEAGELCRFEGMPRCLGLSLDDKKRIVVCED